MSEEKTVIQKIKNADQQEIKRVCDLLNSKEDSFINELLQNNSLLSVYVKNPTILNAILQNNTAVNEIIWDRKKSIPQAIKDALVLEGLKQGDLNMQSKIIYFNDKITSPCLQNGDIVKEIVKNNSFVKELCKRKYISQDHTLLNILNKKILTNEEIISLCSPEFLKEVNQSNKMLEEERNEALELIASIKEQEDADVGFFDIQKLQLLTNNEQVFEAMLNNKYFIKRILNGSTPDIPEYIKEEFIIEGLKKNNKFIKEIVVECSTTCLEPCMENPIVLNLIFNDEELTKDILNKQNSTEKPLFSEKLRNSFLVTAIQNNNQTSIKYLCEPAKNIENEAFKQRLIDLVLNFPKCVTILNNKENSPQLPDELKEQVQKKIINNLEKIEKDLGFKNNTNTKENY